MESVDNLEWDTSDGQSHNIVADACDSHKCNTSAGQDSRKISHKRNLNPELGNPLNKIHDWITNINRNGQHMTILVHAHK